MIEVTVLIPVLNEEKYIEKCMESVISQDFPKGSMELIIVDGMSTDATRDILERYIQQYSWIKLLDNPKKIIPCALNIGIKAAKGAYILRMDAHSEYANDYISQSVAVIKETGADDVGGSLVAKGKTSRQRAIAAAYYSPFALGGGGQQNKADYEGYVDTVFLGCYRRDVFDRIGLYDEALPRNEDDDLNYRLINSGGKIYLSPKIKTVYYPRDTFSGLAKQYYGYGFGKPSLMKKYGKPTNLKQLVPAFFVVFLICGAILSFFIPAVRKIYFSILTLYVLFDMIVSMRSDKVYDFKEKMGLFYAHIVIHVAYGLGYLKGLL